MFIHILSRFRQRPLGTLALSNGVANVKRKLSRTRVFALKGFTIKCVRGKFFVSPTGHDSWAGPYKSLHHAIMAIARKLACEFTERDQRLQQWEQRHE